MKKPIFMMCILGSSFVSACAIDGAEFSEELAVARAEKKLERSYGIFNIWQCSKCEMYNSGFDSHCTSCGYPRNGHVPDEDDSDDDEW